MMLWGLWAENWEVDVMKKILHPVYRDYPEQPYISPERDLTAWEKTPEKFPYGVVGRKQMQRLPEGLLPGDVVMLWRIHFGNFTNESVIPQYFEYRYGVESGESIATLLRLGLARQCGAVETLPLVSMVLLKRILKENGLGVGGKRSSCWPGWWKICRRRSWRRRLPCGSMK